MCGLYVPTVEQKPCESNPCLNGGVCTPAGSNYSCACKKNYVGDKCESKYDMWH